ncbi:MAG: hypothetical protein JHD02_06320 [Thermoleophilaceae bacterium]|nr:hypothetical protein [Thermoleophilaceae bacterium]
MSRRSFSFPVAAICALILAAPALAASGHATYYKIKGGALNFNISASSTLSNDYGIELSDNASGGGGNVLGTFALKKGAFVYESSKAMTADAKNSQAITIVYDTRGPSGNKAGTTTVKIDRLGLTVGKTSSFLIGHVSGSSTVPGITVAKGEYRIFNIGGGKMKKSRSSSYKYVFSSNDLTFNSQLTNLLNSFGTPKGTNKASAKIDLGGMSVKVK